MKAFAVSAPVPERQQGNACACPPAIQAVDAPHLVVAGMQKTSLIDYPGKVASVIFLTGCNFTCPFCHNPDLALGRWPQKITLTQLNNFLCERRTFLDGVVITGGEPTLYPGLAHLCRTIKAIGLAVKLDTNGSRPEVLADLIHQKVVDYVAMDVKTAPDRYGPPLCPSPLGENVLKSIRLLLRTSCDYEFRTTCVPPFVNQEDILKILHSIKGARRYVLQRFRPQTVLARDFFPGKNTSGVSEAQMLDFQSMAETWVQNCLIR